MKLKIQLFVLLYKYSNCFMDVIQAPDKESGWFIYQGDSKGHYALKRVMKCPIGVL